MIPPLSWFEFLRARRRPSRSWSDRKLVRACRHGDEKAWESLVRKYQQFVWSIPLARGLSSELAAEVFQRTWLRLHDELRAVERTGSVRPRLLEIVLDLAERAETSQQEDGAMAMDAPLRRPAAISLEQVQADQDVREAIYRLCPLCQRLIEAVFFSAPPEPFNDVAERLGLGRSGADHRRRRCERQLERALAGIGG